LKNSIQTAKVNKRFCFVSYYEYKYRNLVQLFVDCYFSGNERWQEIALLVFWGWIFERWQKPNVQFVRLAVPF